MICPFCGREIPSGESRCIHCAEFSEYGYFNEIDDMFEEDGGEDFQQDGFDGYDE